MAQSQILHGVVCCCFYYRRLFPLHQKENASKVLALFVRLGKLRAGAVNSMQILASVFFYFLLSSSAVWACELEVRKTSLPYNVAQSTCFDRYLEERDLAFRTYDQSREGKIVFPFAGSVMQMNEMLLVELGRYPVHGLGREGRMNLLRNLYRQMQASLKNEHGSCKLKMSREALVFEERISENQPGTRLSIRSGEGDRWTLKCPNAEGNLELVKSGDYIFVFLDIYENRNPTEIGNQLHLFHYLWSFR